MRKFLLLFFIFLVSSSSVFARSGCCSHHGGVCGCGCCDGTGLSAICAPHYPECSGGAVQEVNTVYIPPSNTPRPLPTWTPRPTLTPTRKPTLTVTPLPTKKPVLKKVKKKKNITPSPTQSSNFMKWFF